MSILFSAPTELFLALNFRFSIFFTFRILVGLSVSHQELTLWFSKGDSGTRWCNAGRLSCRCEHTEKFWVTMKLPNIPSPFVALLTEIARIWYRALGYHKSIRAASRSCFEVVLWYTWLHRMQHGKAAWYDMTRYIKVNRVAVSPRMTSLSFQNRTHMTQ